MIILIINLMLKYENIVHIFLVIWICELICWYKSRFPSHTFKKNTILSNLKISLKTSCPLNPKLFAKMTYTVIYVHFQHKWPFVLKFIKIWIGRASNFLKIWWFYMKWPICMSITINFARISFKLSVFVKVCRNTFMFRIVFLH